MQEGLRFLWLLSLSVSAVAWLYREGSLAKKKGISNRGQISGYELAREILNRHHFTRTAVQLISPRVPEARFHRDELLLNEKTYYGTSLTGLAEALHETMGFVESSKMFLPTKPSGRGGRFFQGLVLSSWILLGAGILLSPWTWIFFLGQLFFVLAFFLALASLAGEWEVAQRSVASLAVLDRLGMDERIHMKEILEVLRWTPLAEMFKIPMRTLPRFRVKSEREAKKARTPA